jgi:hypothetical protein
MMSLDEETATVFIHNLCISGTPSDLSFVKSFELRWKVEEVHGELQLSLQEKHNPWSLTRRMLRESREGKCTSGRNGKRPRNFDRKANVEVVLTVFSRRNAHLVNCATNDFSFKRLVGNS